ncbi:DUF982 domain-containing protein [Phyllobacterium ifriqiyense]|uniref:DUF982 domain-containing protein n=1 Tax=Phyllobacterium ifriqiyense TaxID=314238 RepID=UPI003391CFB1
MIEKYFMRPISILVGLGIPTDIHSVMEAYQLLNDWPVHSRDSAHSLALNACKGVLTGTIEAETARGLFITFAKKHDLLAPEIGPALGHRHGGENLRVL